jgi:hypothetical protein
MEGNIVRTTDCDTTYCISGGLILFVPHSTGEMKTNLASHAKETSKIRTYIFVLLTKKKIAYIVGIGYMTAAAYFSLF